MPPIRRRGRWKIPTQASNLKAIAREDEPLDTKSLRLMRLIPVLTRIREGLPSDYSDFCKLVNVGLALSVGKAVIPTIGGDAYTIWSTILRLGFHDRRVLEEIYQHVLNSTNNDREVWAHMYEFIIRHYLLSDVSEARRWHRRLWKVCPPSQDGFLGLAKSAVHSKKSLRLYQQVLAETDFLGLYDLMIPLLCSREQYAAAYEWHDMLMQRRDLPATSAAAEPLMQYTAIFGDQAKLKEITRSLLEAGVPFTASTGTMFGQGNILTREVMNQVLGETFSIAPKDFNDKMGARLLATRAFNVETVISGMRLFGFNVIGPLSMRELVARDSDPRMVRLRIAQLRSSGISIGPSKFCRLVKRFAIQDQSTLLSDLLASDQHPDTLEDWKIQESLLAEHAEAKDWRQFDLTAATLSELSPEPTGEVWNLKLRVQVTRNKIKEATRIMDGMLVAGAKISLKTAKYVCQRLLRHREPGKRPVSLHDGHDDLGFVIQVLNRVTQSGSWIPPEMWAEVLRRLGQTGRLKELEQLALSLASQYQISLNGEASVPDQPHRKANGDKAAAIPTIPGTLPRHHLKHPLRILISPQLQKAIVAWGFLAAPSQAYHVGLGPLSQRPWTRGLSILKRLRESGVCIHTTAVQQAFHQRLLILYGPGRSDRTLNRALRAGNNVPLETMISEAEQVWGPNLIRPDPVLQLALPQQKPVTAAQDPSTRLDR
ncbi:MAG: hypothetical protein M1817_004605 [Caeruleum heppii]|nr:MAG: hypothetical protein M1817_004605 [Caeruleum heppii]